MNDLDKVIELTYKHYGTCPLYYDLIKLKESSGKSDKTHSENKE